MQGDKSVESHSRHDIGENVYSTHVNKSTGRLISGELFPLRISPGLASNAIVGVFSFRENLGIFFISDTSMEEMHTYQAVSVFGMVSLWVNAHITVSFSVEILMLIEITPWMLTCFLIPG
ncbi:hypothetical protein TNCV_3432091 [Trichonephila clavipes]|nr:hypothetical protein TNCV_3432091 [Trichonephila clavipes]